MPGANPLGSTGASPALTTQQAIALAVDANRISQRANVRCWYDPRQKQWVFSRITATRRIPLGNTRHSQRVLWLASQFAAAQ